MTDGNDEPNYITLAGTFFYQEIRIQESNRNNTYNNEIYVVKRVTIEITKAFIKIIRLYNEKL